MPVLDSLLAAFNDLARIIDTNTARINAMDGELASLIRQQSEIRDRLVLIEKNWQ